MEVREYRVRRPFTYGGKAQKVGAKFLVKDALTLRKAQGLDSLGKLSFVRIVPPRPASTKPEGG